MSRPASIYPGFRSSRSREYLWACSRSGRARAEEPFRGPGSGRSCGSRVYLAHILESIDKIERFTMDGKVRFLRDPMVHDAVVRNLEIIGEAAKRVDDAYRTAHPEVPWRALAGLRDVPIHQHEGVDLERLWTVVERDLPQVRLGIRRLLPRLDALERELAGETVRSADVEEDRSGRA